MICKGGKRSGGSSLAAHLLKTENERVVIVELKHTATQDLREALKDMELATKMTKAKTGLYHAQINPAMGERMTPKQWQYVVDEMETRLGLENQPRAVVYHEKKGRPHMHVVWQRTDIEHGKVIDTKNDYYIHKKLGRDLEKRFSHQQLKDEFSKNWEKMNERQQTIRDGYTPKQLKARISEIYKKSQNPIKFQSELKKAGFDLAHGKRGIVMVSEKGEFHSLMRYTGEKKKDVEKKLQPILKTLSKAEEIGIEKQHQKSITRDLEKKIARGKKTFVENAFNILDKDEIGKTTAKFEKIKAEFKQKQYEQLKQEFKDNDDAFAEMKHQYGRSKEQDEEIERKRGYER